MSWLDQVDLHNILLVEGRAQFSVSVDLAWNAMNTASNTPRAMALVRVAGAAFVLAAAMHVTGCSYLEMVQRHRRLRDAFEQQPRLGLVQEFAPEQCLQIVGGLHSDPNRDEPLAIIALSQQYARNEVVGWRMVPGSVGYYSVLLPEGHYDLLVLADLNRDGVFGGDEVVGRTPPGTPFAVDRLRAADGFLLDGPALRLDYEHPSVEDLPVPIKVAVNSQVMTSLDDDFFDPGYGVMGLYNPSKFLEHTQGYLFGLEPLDEDKTQVLFVHGVTGTPRDWKFLVDGIDRSRFQPWFFFYPAGLPLDRTGAILAQLIQHLATGPRFKLQRLVVVAHSMGGLVARSALQRLSAPRTPAYLKMYVSLSTPYGGHDAAGAAEKHASEVVPSWHDLAPGSPYLRALTATPLPADLPFFLLFSYGNPARLQYGPSSDGVVTLRSELDLAVHLQATRSYGFDVSHTGILDSAAVRDLFNQLIAPTAPPQDILHGSLGVVKRVLTLPSGGP
jgi:triacylglycerol esterase/lipase EstA (alpha/beta hydrolase family)